MKKKTITPKTLKGFRDFLPEKALGRQFLKDKLREIFASWGYDPLETPALEYLETFKGQIGEEEKLFYRFKDQGGRLVALRYDQTIPTCRVVAQYPGKIDLPFKRYQIQPVWRAEKPQKGRYREFIQADADIFGVEGPEADAELIALSLDIFKQLGFKETTVLVNDRSLFKDIPYPAIAAIDKLKKIGREKVIAEIAQKTKKTKKEAQNILEKITNLKPSEIIKTIFSYLKNAGFPNPWFKFEPTLARSFSYSTGPIWEVVIPGFKAGSVLGGERYDRVVSAFGKKDVPGTGFGLGFDRTLEAMEEFSLLPTQKTKTQVLVAVFNPGLLESALRTTLNLRKQSLKTDLYPAPKEKLAKQLRYADKKEIPFVVIIGPDEARQGEATLKNLKTKKQKTLPQKDLASEIKKQL
jgi:histidyl-tRNA synthetase